jgi:hypothetical protein
MAGDVEPNDPSTSRSHLSGTGRANPARGTGDATRALTLREQRRATAR